MRSRPARWTPGKRPDQKPRSGFVLITVLVVIAFLALAAYRYNDLMRSEYIASHGAQRSAETRALAESGLHYAMAVLSGGQPLAANTSLQVEVDPSNNSPLKGNFQILEVVEESAKLNLNALLDLDGSGETLREVLQKTQAAVPELTDDVISAIIDWMDEDDEFEEQGAENEYYMALEPPYRCKNGPIDSLDELLLVKGVTPSIVNGSEASPGLRSLFTANTREVNYEPEGSTIVRLNEGDLATLETNLSTVVGDPTISQFIMAYRLYGNKKAGSSGSGASGGSSSSGTSGGGGTLYQSTPSPLSGGASSPGTSGGGGAPMSGGASSPSGTPATSSGSRGGTSSAGAFSGGSSGAAPAASVGSGGADRVITSSGAFTVTPTGGGTSGQSSAQASAPVVVDPALLQAQIDKDKQPNFFRQLKKVKSIFDLAATDVSVSYQSGNKTVTGTLKSPLKDPAIASQYLPLLFSGTSPAAAPDSSDKVELPARVNVMSAPYEVLSLLPGLEDQDVQNILTNRPQPGDSTGDTLAWLMTKAQISASKLSRVENYLTTRPKLVRVVSVGKLDGFGVNTVLEGMIDLSGPRPRLAGVRDLTDLYRSSGKSQTP